MRVFLIFSRATQAAASGGDDVQTLLAQDVKEHPVMVYMKGTPDAPQASGERVMSVV